MSRLTTAQATEVAKTGFRLAFMLKVAFPGGNYTVTDADTDLSYGGETYKAGPYILNQGGVQERSDGKPGVFSFSLSAADPRNLVSNGDGATGDNTNFSSFTYVADSSAPNGRAFEVTATSGTAYTPDTLIPVDTTRSCLLSTGVEFAPRNLLGSDAGIEQSSASIYHYLFNEPIANVGLAVGDVVSIRAKCKSTTGADQVYISIFFKDGGGTVIGSAVGSPVTSSTYQDSVSENITVPSGTATVTVNGDRAGSTETHFWDYASLNIGATAIAYETTIAPTYDYGVPCYDSSGALLGTVSLATGSLTTSYQTLSGTITPADYPANTVYIKPSLAVTTSDGSAATVRESALSVTDSGLNLRALVDAYDWHFAEVTTYMVLLDADRNIIGIPITRGTFYLSTADYAWGRGSLINCSAMPYTQLLKRKNGVITSNADQQRRYAGDTFWANAFYIADMDITWGDTSSAQNFSGGGGGGPGLILPVQPSNGDFPKTSGI